MLALLDSAKADLLVIHGRPNVQYLTGYDGAGFSPWLLVRGEQRQLVHYTADEDTFEHWSASWKLVPFGPADDEIDTLIRTLGDGAKSVSGDLGWWSADEFSRVGAGLDDRLTDSSKTFTQLRRRKTPWEQDQLRTAGAITHQVMASLIELAAHGATGRELAVELHKLAIGLGSGPLPPTPYVAVGPATFMNHRTWDVGSELAGPYLFEFATTCRSYGVPLSASDTIDAGGRRALSSIQRGLSRIEGRMGPSVPAAAIDRLMRDSISEAGFELRHRSGYSIGLGEADSWMEGRVARLSPTADYTLEPGMAFHVVGSVVSRGVFGVAQSMSVLVTESGIEHLAGPLSRWRGGA